MSQRTLVTLWLAVALIGILGFKLDVATDMFWQVKLGQIMLREGQIPQFDRFTYTHAGELAPPIGWLAQTLFASLYGLGGWQLARLVHQLALVGALLVAAATCRRGVTSPLSVAVAMTIAFLVILSNADLRPQSFGLLGFAILLALARGRMRFWIKLIVATPIMVVWQNMHPSVVLGMVALGALAAADFLDWKGDQSNLWSSVVLALLALAVQFATPLGYHILEVSQDNLRISRDVLRLPEWLHPWDSAIALETIYFYWMTLLGSSIGIVWFWNRLCVRDRVLFFAMTGLSVYAARFIIFWAVALIPLWADLLERLIPHGMFAWARDREDKTSRALGRGCSWLPDLPSSSAFTSRVLVRSSVPRYHWMVSERPALSSRPGRGFIVTSVGVVRCFSRALRIGECRWTSDSYFFSDPAEWQSIDDARAGRIPLDELERTHRPDAFFLYPGRDRALIEVLSMCPRWRACFSGPTCVAFVRAG